MNQGLQGSALGCLIMLETILKLLNNGWRPCLALMIAKA